MKIIVANPSVPPHVQQTVLAYQEAGYLKRFLTSFLEHPAYPLSRWLNRFEFLKKELTRRSFPQLAIDKLMTRPAPEFVRSFSARKLGPVLTDRIWEWSELGFDKWVSKQITASPPDAVHVYEHAALATLKQARKLNIFSIYEQPSQHHAFFYQIARQQLELYTGLKTASADLLVNEKAEKRNRRRDEELAIASLVLCNSTFTKNTLTNSGVDPAKIAVIPLAFPPVSIRIKPARESRPMIFLYAGNQSLRKASHILYEAWRRSGFQEHEAELWLVGKMLLPEELRSGLPGKVVIRENIPHKDLMELYHQADVFILPTLADGFGMVVTEAMSQGLPVIATENCCAYDIIEPMKNGWIIPAGDVKALAEQMRWCADHAKEVASCAAKAKVTAARWQWPEYRKALAETIFTKWQQHQKS